MARSLAGKAAIVTGASSGIGAATARALTEAGARVASGARRAERLEGAFVQELDVASRESCERFVEAAARTLDGIDILVNAAGLALGREPFTRSTEIDEDVVLDTNLRGLIRMTRLCLPYLEKAGGHIVNVGSIYGRMAPENAAVYTATKFGVRGFSYALREDLLGKPIRVTTIDPGMTETEASLVRLRGNAREAAEVYEQIKALAPDEVADCVLFAVTRPPHVNIDELVVKPLAQISGQRMHRTSADAAR